MAAAVARTEVGARTEAGCAGKNELRIARDAEADVDVADVGACVAKVS